MKKLLSSLMLFLFLFNCWANNIPTERTLVFGMNTDGSKHYRIPALITTQNGTLVAIADKRGDEIGDLPNIISVIAKRSTDNGKTWSEQIMIAEGNAATQKTYGDAAVVMDQSSGKLIAIYAGDNGLWNSTKDNKMGIYISESTDDGLTWTAPRSITDQIYKSNWFGAFAASGRALQLKDGRILFVVAARPTADWGGALHNYACYSDDGGATWAVSSNAGDTYGDEAKIVELENGNLLMSIRNRNKGYRKFSISTDRGQTWGTSFVNQDLLDPACNGDIIRYSWTEEGKSILLHSLPGSSSTRENITVYLSEDDGSTWKTKKQICDSYSAYSSLTVLADGTIGALVEEGKWDNSIAGEDGFNIQFVRFPVDWLYTPERTITIKANNDAWGTVSGGGTSLGGIVISATPNNGYEFIHWLLNNEIVSTNATYTDNTDGDKEYTAVFAKRAMYCSPTAPGEIGPHYGAISGYVKVNGNLAFNFDQSKSVNNNKYDFNFYNVHEMIITPGDIITIGITGSNPHSKWAQAVAYFDWNANDSFEDEGEEFILYSNSDTPLVAREFTFTTPEIIGEEFALRLLMGEAPSHGNSGTYTPCATPFRGSVHTFKVKLANIPSRTITLEATPTEGGTVTGGGISEGPITCTATPNDRYKFINWTNKATDEVVSTDLSFTDVTEGDKTYVAHFAEINEYQTVVHYFSNGTSQQNRYLKSAVAMDLNKETIIFNATNENELPRIDYDGTIGEASEGSENGALIDYTAVPIEIALGTTSFDVTFYGWTEAMTIAGASVNAQLQWTQQAVFVDWNNNYLFTDSNENCGKNSDTGKNEIFHATTGFTKTINIPENTPEGTYRMRVLYYEPFNATDAWHNTIMDNNITKLRNGKGYDFDIKIVAPSKITEHQQNNISIILENNNIIIEGAKQNDVITIFTPSGQTIYKNKLNNNNYISTKAKGILILRIGNQVYKIIK